MFRANRRNMSYFVYLLKSIDNSLYIGQTNNLEKRVHEHIDHLDKAAKFTKEHDLDKSATQKNHLLLVNQNIRSQIVER